MSKRLHVHLDNAYIFRTSGGTENEPAIGNLLCATGVKSRVYRTDEDLLAFFQDVGVPNDLLGRLMTYYAHPADP